MSLLKGLWASLWRDCCSAVVPGTLRKNSLRRKADLRRWSADTCSTT